MKNLKKEALIASILILLLAVTVFSIDTVTVNAAPENYRTFSYISATPTPTGVGENIIVTFRLDKTPPTAGGGVTGDRWQGFMVAITKPDATTESKGPYSSDAVGGAYFIYTPTATGTYKFKMEFPGQWINTTDTMGPFGLSPGYQRYYQPSQSAIAEVVVQQDAIAPIPNNPLPTDYWTRPIYGENKGWNVIAGNWLMQGYDYVGRTFAGYTAFAPFNSGPETSHVMWTRPIQFGGIMGGQFGDDTFYTGLAYEQLYCPMIIQGRIIYSPVASPPGYGTYCVDLRTGEQIWYQNFTLGGAGGGGAFLQIYDYQSQNQHGGLAYIWNIQGSTWKMYDAFTGNWILDVVGVPSGTIVADATGNILVYTFRANLNISGTIMNQLQLWNVSQTIWPWNMSNPSWFAWWRPTAAYATYPRVDASRGLMWVKNITAFGAGSTSGGPLGFGTTAAPGLKRIAQDVYGNPTVLLAGWGDSAHYPWTFEYAAYSLKPNEEGRLMWSTTVTDIYGTSGERLSQNINDGVFAIFDEPTEKFHIYDIQTGQQRFETESFSNAWGLFSRDYHIAYGMLYSAGYDGHVRAYSTTTGALVWDYYFGSSGYETAYGTYPVYNGFTIADGKIYVANDEHSPDAVLWRGGKTVCLDAYTGEMLWNISGWLRIPAIADGYLTSCNAYDNQIYSIGKGPSAITVAAASTAVPLGTGVTITGTVTDQSTGAKDTPAISDVDMTAWMQYLYQQKPMPENAKGVPVKLTAVDPTGHFVDIATVTSDIGGSYGASWIPTTEGIYQITATFEGSKAYGSSFATTYMTVGPANAAVPTTTPTETVPPTQTPETTATPTPVAEPGNFFTTETLLIIGAAVVIVVVVAAAAVLLRKRK